jgi:hypothetical protein
MGLREIGKIGQIVAAVVLAVAMIATGVGAPIGVSILGSEFIALSAIGTTIMIASSLAVAVDPEKQDAHKIGRHDAAFDFDSFRNPIGTTETVPVVYGSEVRIIPEIVQASVEPQDTLNDWHAGKGSGSLGHENQSISLTCLCGEGPLPKGWLKQIYINGSPLWDEGTSTKAGTGDGSTTVFKLPGEWIHLDTLDLYVAGVQQTNYQAPAAKTALIWKVSAGWGERRDAVTWEDDSYTTGIDYDTLEITYKNLPRGYDSDDFTHAIHPKSKTKFVVRWRQSIPNGTRVYATYDSLESGDVQLVTDEDGVTTATFGTAPANGAAITIGCVKSKFPGVTVEHFRGEVNQPPPTGQNEIRQTYAVGPEMTKATPRSWTTKNEVDNFAVNIGALRGMVEYWYGSSNRKSGELTAQVEVKYRQNGETKWTTLHCGDNGKAFFEIRGWTSSPKHWLIDAKANIKKGISNGYIGEKTLTEFTNARYDIQLTRLDTDTTDDESQNTIWWTHVTEIVEEVMSHPGSAYFILRAVGDEDINGAVPQIAADIAGREVYDPRDGTTAGSANPALCAMDFLASSRFGPGVSRSSFTDAWETLADWHDETITVKTSSGAKKSMTRCEVCCVLDTARDPFEVVSDILMPAFAVPIRRGQEWDIWIDTAASSSKTYYYSGSASNQIESAMTAKMEALSKTPTELLIHYRDAEYDFESRELLIPAVTATKNRVRQDVTVNCCARREQVAQFGFHLMRQIELMPRLIEFQAMPDGILSSPGDVITVQSEIEGATTGKLWRVLSVGWDFDLKVSLVCREYSSTFYGQAPETITTIPNNTDLPASQSIPAAGEILTAKPSVTITEETSSVYS